MKNHADDKGICFTQLFAGNPDPWMQVYNEFERTLYDALA